MTKIEQALEMAQKLNVTILTDDNGAYKFKPSIFPGRDQTIYIHASNTAIRDRKTGLEWRLSREYDKQQYQVRESSISVHTFPTIPALCTWLEYEIDEKKRRENEEIMKQEAQTRADNENEPLYVIRLHNTGFIFVCTYGEMIHTYGDVSLQVIHTANPTHKPTGEEIAADAKPGDTVVYLNFNGQEREATFKHADSDRGVMAELDGFEIGIRYFQIRGLKKADVTPAPDPKEEETPEVTGCCYCGESVETSEAIQVGVNMYWCGCDEKKPDDEEQEPASAEPTILLASEQPAPAGLTDPEYTELQHKIMSFNPATGSTDEILKDMATLHFERERRTMEFYSGKRSRRSVQSRKMIACRDALQVKLGYRISLNKRGVYARSQRQ